MHAMPVVSYASLGDLKTDTSKFHLQKFLGYIISQIIAMWELFLLVLANLSVRTTVANKISPYFPDSLLDSSYCLSWRVAVEANNAGPWRTVPMECVMYVGRYMLGGQYNKDLETVMEMIDTFLDGMEASDDAMDAWVLDVDDTCLSNLLYYQGQQFGGVPFNPVAFKSWAGKGMCPAILPVLGLFNKLIERGYKVFLLTGRDDLTFRDITTANLQDQGYLGYERLIMRTAEYKGKGAKIYKSAIRKQLIDEGFRLRGNVGDQWSDLQGDYLADRNFKIPNPMYYVP